MITCAGADVLKGEIHMPQRGAAWADLRLDAQIVPTGQVTLAADGGLSLAMTVLDAQSGFDPTLDAVHVRLVAGAGGLSKSPPPDAYENAQLRDPLLAILAAVGEAASPTIDEALLSIDLGSWSVSATTTRALDALAAAAGAQLGESITWRVLADGRVWIGAETWPSQAMPDGADVLEPLPSERRFVIGCDEPSLMPGVALAGVGNVAAVDHFFDADRVRSWAWLA